ncbi:MAG: hypothetical protein M1812_003081 [Candelaria pacifica]|nr:MAG: hypothetical protein M1812_003081 [Candelaria pacifica]
MVPKAFPYPLGVGIDICHIPRVQSLITRDGGKWLSRFAKRIFNDHERNAFKRKVDASNNSRDNRLLAQWLAGRFAAKEAAFKAVGTRRLSWHDITICDGRPVQPTTDRCSGSGEACGSIVRQIKPYALIHPPRRSPSPSKNPSANRVCAEDTLPSIPETEEEPLMEAQDGWDSECQVAELSISHDGDYATAVVLAV